MKFSHLWAERSFCGKEPPPRALLSDVKILFSNNSVFQSVGKYRNYTLINSLAPYAEKLAAKMDRYVERVKLLIQQYRIDSKKLKNTPKFYFTLRALSTPTEFWKEGVYRHYQILRNMEHLQNWQSHHFFRGGDTLSTIFKSCRRADHIFWWGWKHLSWNRMRQKALLPSQHQRLRCCEKQPARPQ